MDDFQIELDRFKEDKQLPTWCELLFNSDDEEIVIYTIGVIKSQYPMIGEEIYEEYDFALVHHPIFFSQEKTTEFGWRQGKYQRLKEVILPYLKKYVTYDNF